MNIVDQLCYAKKVSTYEVYAASGTTYWLSTTEYRITCAADKRTFILYGTVKSSQSATRTLSVKNAADAIIQTLYYVAAGTGTIPIPDTVAVGTTLAAGVWPLVLDAGEYLQVLYGAAQDTDAYCSFTLLEVDI